MGIMLISHGEKKADQRPPLTFWIIPKACPCTNEKALQPEARLAAERKIKKQPKPAVRTEVEAHYHKCHSQ
jgi:hypothetical protein